MTLISRRPDTPACRARNNRANRHEPTWASIFREEEDIARAAPVLRHWSLLRGVAILWPRSRATRTDERGSVRAVESPCVRGRGAATWPAGPRFRIGSSRRLEWRNKATTRRLPRLAIDDSRTKTYPPTVSCVSPRAYVCRTRARAPMCVRPRAGKRAVDERECAPWISRIWRIRSRHPRDLFSIANRTAGLLTCEWSTFRKQVWYDIRYSFPCGLHGFRFTRRDDKLSWKLSERLFRQVFFRTVLKLLSKELVILWSWRLSYLS